MTSAYFITGWRSEGTRMRVIPYGMGVLQIAPVFCKTHFKVCLELQKNPDRPLVIDASKICGIFHSPYS